MQSEKSEKNYNHTVKTYIYIDKEKVVYRENQIICMLEFVIENMHVVFEIKSPVSLDICSFTPRRLTIYTNSQKEKSIYNLKAKIQIRALICRSGMFI